ncbi:hypothetical protein HaLaN_19417, partial [Haematococcus lacustris]
MVAHIRVAPNQQASTSHRGPARGLIALACWATKYEVELFKLSVDILARSQPECAAWAPGNWTWQCIDNWSAMLSQLAAAPAVRQCDVVVAGVSATADRVAQVEHTNCEPLQNGVFVCAEFPSHGMHMAYTWHTHGHGRLPPTTFPDREGYDVELA